MDETNQNFEEKLNKNNHNSVKKHKRKIINLGVIAIIVIVAIPALSIGYFILQFVGHTYTAEITYEEPATLATPSGEAVYETYESGSYIIGQSPSEYATGNEEEFTTSESGTYVANEDFPAGTYDIVATSGHGKVSTTGGNSELSENMQAVNFDNSYIPIYNNYTFVEGETLNVNGVAVQLLPQTNETMVIEPGEYDITVLDGSATMISSDPQGIVTTKIEGDDNSSIRTTFDNYKLVEGEELTVSGTKIMLAGKLPAKEAKPAHMVTETMTFNTGLDYTECKVNGEVVNYCSTLKHHEKLQQDINKQIDESFWKYIYQ